MCVCVCASRRRNKIELGTKGRRKTGNLTCNSRGREFGSSFHKQAIVLDSRPESELHLIRGVENSVVFFTSKL
jgi:hypothetical protein